MIKFECKTQDPKFDPKAAILMNGFLFVSWERPIGLLRLSLETLREYVQKAHNLSVIRSIDILRLIDEIEAYLASVEANGEFLSPEQAAVKMRDLLADPTVPDEHFRERLADILGRVDPEALAQAGVV